ncbi:MAG: peptidase S16 [Maricaulis sp.]|jgi:Lon protease-like protein|nr:peptidase S16 [Maricaulis sp.]HAQ35371.1 peptidase S16 [Alphaproteobacteria bacterium]
MNQTLPALLPLFPLDSAILLPGETLPLNVFEPRYLNMTDDAMTGDKLIGIIQTRPGGEKGFPALEAIGGAGRIVSHKETDDGRYLISLEGIGRFRLDDEVDLGMPYRVGRVDWSPFAGDRAGPDALLGADRDRLMQLLQAWFQSENLVTDWDAIAQAPLPRVVNQLAMGAPFSAREKQDMLEAPEETERFETLSSIIERRLAEGAGGTRN